MRKVPIPRGGCAAVVAIAGLAIVLIALTAFTPVLDGPLGPLQPTCSIGVTYMNANITIQSWTASQDCNQIVDGAHILSIHFNPGEAYLLTEAPQGHVLCEVDQARRHIIVRDQGIFEVVGRLVCAELSNGMH